MRDFTLRQYLLGLIFSLLLVSVANANPNIVECAYLTKSKLVPVSKTAIALAESLGVTTCGRDNTSNFRLKGRAMGLTSVVVGMTKARLKIYNDFKIRKLMKKKTSISTGSKLW